MWQYAVKNYANRPCLGDRRHGGDSFKWKTFGEVEALANKIGTGLIQQCGVRKTTDCKVGIFASNCWEWSTNGLAAANFNYCMVPMYDTLGDQAMRYIVQQCEFDVVLIDTETRVNSFIKNVQGHPEGKKVKYVVSFHQCDEKTYNLARQHGLNLIWQEDLIRNVVESNIRSESHCPPKPEDLFCICYTSGTTGNPKGVMHTHSSWNADMQGAMLATRAFSEDDVWLSYLPSAHVFERMVQSFMFLVGGRCGFFGGDPRNLIADAAALKPTFFGGVPRVWNKIYAKLESAKLESNLKKKLITWATDNKVELVKKGINRNNTIYDKVVFGKIQALLGGRVNGGVSSAAPMKNEVLNTLRAALGTYINEAYGQTECSACCTATMMNDPNQSVGAPIGSVAIKLASVEEMNYFAENDYGEICLKGPIVMKGYYKNAEKTAEAIDKDGWLHTGDVGRWTEHGTLQIVDRAKHIFKTSLGEYIAPEKIENIYLMHSAVGQCFVYGDSLKNTIVAIVIPDPDNFLGWAKTGGTIDAAIQSKSVQDRMLKELQNLGKTNGLKGFENIKAFTFVNELMSVEAGLLTPTMKTKRPQCKIHFMPLINEMYEKLGE